MDPYVDDMQMQLLQKITYGNLASLQVNKHITVWRKTKQNNHEHSEAFSCQVTIRSFQNIYSKIRKKKKKKKIWKVIFLYGVPQEIIWVIKEFSNSFPNPRGFRE